MGEFMLAFSNKIIILKDKIKIKNSSDFYDINDDMYDYLKRLYESSFKEFNCEKDVDQFLIDENIIVTVNSNNTYNPFVKNQKHIQTELNRLFIQVTEQCNLRCKHCYVESCPEKTTKLTKKDIIQFVEKAIEIGITQVDFTGGEIFMEGYIFELLEYLSEKPVTVTLFSNLTLLNEKQILKLKKYSCLRDIITSIDYNTPEKHNIFRGGKNAYQKTQNNIKLLLDLGIKVKINTLVMDDNHQDVVEIFKDFTSIGITCNLDNIIPEGRMITKKEINENAKKNALVISTIMNCFQEKKEICIKNIEPFNKEISGEFCGVGKSMIYITASGDVTLCPSLTEGFKLGTIYDKELSNIVDNLKKFNKLSCERSDCKFIEKCTGGCRARAMRYLGRITNPDPIACIRFGVDKYEN